jgi:tetratricopeptide (TPR) repeat protein
VTERVICRSCGNRCLPPGGSGAYLCPSCRLPLQISGPGTAGRTGDATAIGHLSLTSFIHLFSRPLQTWTCRLAPIAAVSAVLLLAHRAITMPLPQPRIARPAIAAPIRVTPYEADVEKRYLFRLRQLEADLARDPREYAIRARLGLLTLRLAIHTPDRPRAVARYDAARRRFEQAASLARTRREYEWALAQRDACWEQAPVSDAPDSTLHPDPVVCAPVRSLAVQEQLRLRARFLEARVQEQPRNTRLLCRLGLTYVRLLQATSTRAGSTPGELQARGVGETPQPSETTAGSGSYEPLAARRTPHAARAEECLDAAARHSRSLEMRSEVHLARAALYRAVGDPAAALAAVRQALRLRPNHWPAHLQAAVLLARLGRPEEARAHRALAARWRTPEWL